MIRGNKVICGCGREMKLLENSGHLGKMSFYHCKHCYDLDNYRNYGAWIDIKNHEGKRVIMEQLDLFEDMKL